MCVLSHFSRVQLFATLWTVAHQTPLSMGFSRQEYWSGLPGPPPGIISDPGISNLQLPCCRWILYHWGTGEAPKICPWSWFYTPVWILDQINKTFCFQKFFFIKTLLKTWQFWFCRNIILPIWAHWNRLQKPILSKLIFFHLFLRDDICKCSVNIHL